MEPRYNEPLYNKVLGKTIYFAPGVVKYMEKNLDITKPRYSEQIVSPLVIRYIQVPL